jgi:hypothetical protein
MPAPKFLVVRFAPGAAGNMITSLLQCSPEVAHWDPGQQYQKPKNNWIDYFKKVFPTQINTWLYHEPVGQLHWGTREIFSAKYPRGNDIGLDQYLDLEKIHCTDYYHEQKNAGRYLPIFWHKKFMPEYFNNSKSLIIKLDDHCLRWFDHAVYKKHYEIISSSEKEVNVRLLQNRAEVVPKSFHGTVEFTKTWPSFKEFVKQMIYNNPYRAQYRSLEQIGTWNIPSVSVNLSSLLDKDKIYDSYCTICEFLQISKSLSRSELQLLHTYWRGLHAF